MFLSLRFPASVPEAARVNHDRSASLVGRGLPVSPRAYPPLDCDLFLSRSRLVGLRMNEYWPRRGFRSTELRSSRRSVTSGKERSAASAPDTLPARRSEFFTPPCLCGCKDGLPIHDPPCPSKPRKTKTWVEGTLLTPVLAAHGEEADPRKAKGARFIDTLQMDGSIAARSWAFTAARTCCWPRWVFTSSTAT